MTTELVRCALIAVLACVALGAGNLGCVRQPVQFERWGLAPTDDSTDRDLRERAVVWEQELFQFHVPPEGVLQYRVPVVPDPKTARWLELADQATWTGYLLAALSFRQVGEPTDANLERLESVLSGMELLHDGTGVPGLVARCVLPESADGPVRARPEKWRRAVGAPQYFCRIDTSKDQYSGYVFGLIAAYRLIDKPTVRGRCLRLLEAIARHLDQGDLRIHGVDGKVTRFGDLRGRIFGLPIGVNAAISLMVFESVARASGDGELREAARRRSLELRSDLEPLHFELFGIRNYSNALMAAVALAGIQLTEPDFDLRQRLRRAFVPFLDAFQGEGNAFFFSVGAMYGLSDPEEQEIVRRNLLHAPSQLAIRAVPEERFEIIRRMLLPDRKGRPRSVESLPLALLPPSTFCWRSDPRSFGRKIGGVKELRVSGVDFLVAYWLGRYVGWTD